MVQIDEAIDYSFIKDSLTQISIKNRFFCSKQSKVIDKFRWCIMYLKYQYYGLKIPCKKLY